METEWILVGIGFLGLIGAANAWMIRRIDKVREDLDTRMDKVAEQQAAARHNIRNETTLFLNKIDGELAGHDRAIAKLQMKVFGNGDHQ